MNKLMGIAVAVAVIAGCDNSSATRGVDEPGKAQQGTALELRMRGTGAENFTSLMLVANWVEATVDGQRIDVKPTWSAVNLANMEHAEKIATFVLPEGANVVKFRIQLGAAGGFESATGSGWVDTRNKVLEFETTAAELTRRGRGVVIVDAAKSFVARDSSTMKFVPNFKVN